MISNKRFLDELGWELFAKTGIRNCYGKYCKYLTLEDLFTADSVYIAACHAASGFRDRNDTFAFMSHAWLNSEKLAEKVISGKFRPSYYRQKQIIERGKPRVIRPPKFECKVVQKVLCDYLLRALLEPKIIGTSYASLRGRGTGRMFVAILKALNKGKPGNEILLCDYKEYFASIDTEMMCEMFLSWGMDERVVTLFHSFDPEGIGLSLGNEASQVPASWFPSAVDHALKDKYRVKNVFRFMDDMLVLSENPKQTDKLLQIIREESEKMHLSLKEKKIQKIPWGKPFVFCKERFLFNKEDAIYYSIQNPQVARNEIRKIKAFARKIENSEMTKEAAVLQASAVIGSMETHPNNWKQVQKVKNVLDEKILAGTQANDIRE